LISTTNKYDKEVAQFLKTTFQQLHDFCNNIPSPKKADASNSLLFASSSHPLVPETFDDHTSPLSPARASLKDPKLKLKFPSSADDAAPYLPSCNVWGELPVGKRLLLLAAALLEGGRCGDGGATAGAGAATGGGSNDGGCWATGSGKEEEDGVGAATAAGRDGGAAAAAAGG